MAISRRPTSFTIVLAACFAAGALARPDWPQLGGTPGRVATTGDPVPPISTSPAGGGVAPAFVASIDQFGNAITFVGQAAPVVFGDVVLVPGRVTPAGQGTQWRVFAFRRVGRSGPGTVAWSAAIDAPSVDSRSAVTIDPWGNPDGAGGQGIAIIPSGGNLRAFKLADGSPAWTTSLGCAVVVNAEVAITTDRGLRDRAFITTYSFSGSTCADSGRLWCINIDAASSANPFAPGQVVWSVPIGNSSGNTPTYLAASMLGGVPGEVAGRPLVLVASAGDPGFEPGQILAFPVDTDVPPTPAWAFTHPQFDGFFGGVSIRAGAGASGPVAFAATYVFDLDGRDGELFKIDARTGTLRWSVACRRSASLPIALPDGRVLLSAGLPGFGEQAAIQMFADQGSSGSLLWDSALATWTDADFDGAIDANEYQRYGSWFHQPVVSASGGVLRGVVGVPASNPLATGAFAEVRVVDLNQSPASTGFVVQTFAGAGGSPALSDGELYLLGPTGLHAFRERERYDVDGDGCLSLDDLYAWERSQGSRDVDQNGLVNAADRATLIRRLRLGEREGMVAR